MSKDKRSYKEADCNKLVQNSSTIYSMEVLSTKSSHMNGNQSFSYPHQEKNSPDRS